MREYLTTANFMRALAMGTVVTVMALPRIAQAGDQVGLRTVGCLANITLVAGVVTAWGTKAGMRGPLRGMQETACGLAAALLVALILIPVQHWVIHPVFEEAVRSSADGQWVRLQIPATIQDWIALALWSAGFQTLFCVAAPTCLAARLTGRVWPAIVLAVALSGFVASRQMDAYHVECGRGLLVAASAAKGLLGCMLYVRFGLAACAALSAGHALHLLWDIL